jgi:hypothetical protein
VARFKNLPSFARPGRVLWTALGVGANPAPHKT